MQEHNEGHMKALLTFVMPGIWFAMYMIYWYLLQIDINKTINLPVGLESVGSHEDFAKKKQQSPANNPDDDLALSAAPSSDRSMEDQDLSDPAAAAADKNKSNRHSSSMVECEEEQPRRYRITRLRNIILVSLSLGLSLVTYLILVVSEAPIWLRLLGVAAVIAMGLWQQIGEELRRQRLDRIVAIITMILLAASLMSLATFANKSLKEGEIYRGKARIIGFDYENYDNKDGDVTRTDLEVAWGGEWACPTEDGKQCQAFVQGAMCEAEKKDDNNNNNGGKFRRFLNDNDNNNNADNNNNDNNNANNNNDNNNANNNNDNNGDANYEEEQLEEDVEDEENEVEDLEEENEELQEELEEYEEYADELAEEVVDGTDLTYYWDDDLVADNYWDNQDWGSIWGDYACYDLFDYDMSGATYNADEPPGYDDWPFVSIYGNCKKCEAYIVDYFSTEHFQEIQSYRVQGRNYLILSFFGLILTCLLHFKHKTDPIAEKELELLPNDGGAMA